MQKNNYMDKKLKEKERKVGIGLHGKWEVTLEVKTPINTTFANKVIMFEKTLEFKQDIFLCYGR